MIDRATSAAFTAGRVGHMTGVQPIYWVGVEKLTDWIADMDNFKSEHLIVFFTHAVSTRDC